MRVSSFLESLVGDLVNWLHLLGETIHVNKYDP